MEIGATSTEKGMHMSARERERERDICRARLPCCVG